jgi:hypothetical protein
VPAVHVSDEDVAVVVATEMGMTSEEMVCVDSVPSSEAVLRLVL